MQGSQIRAQCASRRVRVVVIAVNEDSEADAADTFLDETPVGLKYGRETESGNDFALRLEYYRQDGEVPDDQVVSNQRDRDLYPGLDALIVSFSYRFGL